MTVHSVRKIAILGVGLLGGSIGLAARSKINGCRIVGYGHRDATLQKALEIGAIDEAHRTPESAVEDADLVILCTPVSVLSQMIAAIAPALKADAMVTDVGSTKRSVVQAGQNLPRFVGSHPMAGSEKRGIEYARTDLFEQALCIVTPTDQTDHEALATIEAFWKTLGMRLTRLSPEEHDRALAYISHLPHALAAALISIQGDQPLALAGKGFLDATRIASGDGALWRDILQDNRDSMLNALASLRTELTKLESLLDPARADDLARWLNEAAAKRDALLREKLREMMAE